MKATEIDTPQWEDIVFEHRNKAYGAYFIRTIYSRHVATASAITILILGFVLAFPKIADYFSEQENTDEVALKSIKYTDLAPPPPIDKNTPPPPKLDVPPPVKTIIKFLPPKVTDKEVTEVEEMPTIEDVKQNEVGPENVEGTGEIIFEEPVAAVVKESNEDVIFTIVEQPAEYPGGLEAMAKFLQKNMKYPAIARRMNVEGAVYVSFVIERDGAISDIQVVKGISAECDKEAVRVIRLMPLWKAGKQNGKAVRCRFMLPVKFKLAV